MAKISEMEPAAAGAELYRQYMSCHDAWLADRDVRHPSYDTKSWRDTARDAGTLRDPATDANAGLGPVEIQKRGAQDDVEPTLTANSNAGNGGSTPAQDSLHGVYVRGLDHAVRFVPHGGQRLAGDVQIEVFTNGPSNQSRVKAMEQLIPGYSRIR